MLTPKIAWERWIFIYLSIYLPTRKSSHHLQPAHLVEREPARRFPQAGITIQIHIAGPQDQTRQMGGVAQAHPLADEQPVRLEKRNSSQGLLGGEADGDEDDADVVVRVRGAEGAQQRHDGAAGPQRRDRAAHRHGPEAREVLGEAGEDPRREVEGGEVAGAPPERPARRDRLREVVQGVHVEEEVRRAPVPEHRREERVVGPARRRVREVVVRRGHEPARPVDAGVHADRPDRELLGARLVLPHAGERRGIQRWLRLRLRPRLVSVAVEVRVQTAHPGGGGAGAEVLVGELRLGG